MTAQTTAPAFACEGWYDATGAHHACTNDAPKPGGKGRCTRCYSREYAANGTVRAPRGQDAPALTIVPAAECVGWTGSEGTHHACQWPGSATRDGRCGRCERMQAGADTARELVAGRESAPARPASAPAPEPPAVAPAPVLRPRHVRPVMSYAIVCPNCDGPLVQGDRQTIATYRDKALTCRDCGAAWRVDAATLAHHTPEAAAAD